MKRMVVLFFLILVRIGLTHAQVAVVGHIFAEIVENLTVSEEAQLNFGRFAPIDAGGIITISSDGVRSASGNVALAPGNAAAGSFHVTGQKDAYFAVTLPSQEVFISSSDGTKTMTVKNWVSSIDGIGRVKLGDDGTQQVNIGATLMVNSLNENPKGMYSGSYIIRFDYN